MSSNDDHLNELKEIYEYLKCLHRIGIDMPLILIQLAEILKPDLHPDKTIPTLKKMFEEIPKFLEKGNGWVQLQTIENETKSEPIRLLLEFREFQQLFQSIGYLQILHLSNNVLPPGPPLMQLEFLQKVQEQFQSWSPETLQNHHHVLSDTPLHMERQALLQLEPQISWELLHYLIEILKLPINELFHFQEWISRLSKPHLIILIHLLHLEPFILLELKTRIDNDQELMNTENTSTTSTQIDYSTIQRVPNPLGISTDSLSTYSLRIMKQPPPKTVYQRILKPFPTIMLIGGNPDASTSNLFIETTLLRSDTEQELSQSIEGTKIVRIQGVIATFKKLKILSTSQQQGTLFRLKFTLKRYVGNVFELIPSATVISNPVEVFSHTLYLTEKNDTPAPPTVNEVLPPSGISGTKFVILGSNFVNSPKLCVKVGDQEIKCQYHEPGTLICIAPEYPTGGSVPIRVSNDGKNFCDTRVHFNYTIPQTRQNS